jgi:hypothetical protein
MHCRVFGRPLRKKRAAVFLLSARGVPVLHFATVAPAVSFDETLAARRDAAGFHGGFAQNKLPLRTSQPQYVSDIGGGSVAVALARVHACKCAFPFQCFTDGERQCKEDTS